MELTEEQKARIAHNKEIARQRLEERNKRFALENSLNNPTPQASTTSSNSSCLANIFLSNPQKVASMSLNSNVKSFQKSSENLPPSIVYNKNKASTIVVQFFIQNLHRIKVSYYYFP